jgi:4-amino-4-deoxy-L-arabinose transferase-like glycosyltransferase
MNSQTQDAHPTRRFPTPLFAWTLILALFAAIYLAAAAWPPLLDDADATHAEAAAHMAESGDWVTLKVNGIRYLEKPPLPYWIVAGFYRVFGENAFATHLPGVLGVLGCVWIGWLWARRAYGDRAALYTALGMLTAAGTFLFTRFFIPESLLSFFLISALYFFLTGLESQRPNRFYLSWIALALATLTKGLIAPIFVIAAIVPLLMLSGQWRRWRTLNLFSGGLLYLLIAAPWHIMAALRNPDHGHPIGNIPTVGNVHGFAYFYFINEHVMRFLGTRYPHDYNRLPFGLYWILHIVWLFPWSLFAPAAILVAWKTRHDWLSHLRKDAGQTVDLYLENAVREDVASYVLRLKFEQRTNWLLSLFACAVLAFFSLSTNQEYYTWPAYLPLILLTSGVLAAAEENPEKYKSALAWIRGSQTVFAAIGLFAAVAISWGLWQSRNLPFVADIGTLIAHRGVGDYTLSMSSLFDLTGESFAALRLPAVIAAITLLIGPLTAWFLRKRSKHFAATLAVALTCGVFLMAAQIAYGRFSPMLSSEHLAEVINTNGHEGDQLVLYGDQSDSSSAVFYTHPKLKKDALIVNGRSSSMLWGSYYPDAPKIFIDDADLVRIWGSNERHWLFVPLKSKQHVEQLLGARLFNVHEMGEKILYTDSPISTK